MSSREFREGPVTAEEFKADLEANPEWVAARDREEGERQRIVQRNKVDSAPIMEELARAGHPVEWIADLYNQRMNYKSVIPILLKWFPRIENPDVKEDVARALTVRWARPEAAPMMLAELHALRDSDEDRSSLRFAVANALTEVADDSVYNEVVALVRDQRYPIGDRGLLLLALANMRANREPAIRVLRGFLTEDVAPHAVSALGELRATDARAEIEPFLEHEESWVRGEAKKALRKLDTAVRRRS